MCRHARRLQRQDRRLGDQPSHDPLPAHRVRGRQAAAGGHGGQGRARGLAGRHLRCAVQARARLRLGAPGREGGIDEIQTCAPVEGF